MTNLGSLESSPKKSLQLLEQYLKHIELKGNYPRSNITVVVVLGNMFRDMSIPQTGILDAHRQSVLSFLTEVGALTKQLLPNSTHAENEHRLGWWIVGGSTDIGSKVIESVMQLHDDHYVPDVIPSWCKLVDDAYAPIPFSHDPDRLLLNSSIDPSEVNVIELMMAKRQEYDKLVHRGYLSADYVPTETMTDVLAE